MNGNKMNKMEYARNYHYSIRIGLITVKGSVFKAEELGPALKKTLDSITHEFQLPGIDTKKLIREGMNKLSVIVNEPKV